MRLVINENKTKYMVITKNAVTKGNLCVGGHIFEQVEDFKYLEVNINEKSNEIRMRINAAKICYFTMKRMKRMFSSKLLSRRTKERLNYTYMRPIIAYAYDTLIHCLATSTQSDKEKL